VQIRFLVSRDTQTGTYYRYHALAAALVRQGHAVTVHSQQADPGVPAAVALRDGVEYLLPARWRGDSWIDPAQHPLSLLGRWRQALPRADVCHLFQPFENAGALWLRERRRGRGQPTLYAWDWDDLFHGGLCHPGRAWRIRLRGRALGWFERRLPRGTRLVTTCSTYLADLARARGALDTEVIRNGIVPPPAPPPRDELRARHGLPQDRFLLGFVGWTPTEADWCLEALQALDERVRLVCCGVPMDSFLERHPGLRQRVHYLGILPPETARELMTGLDVGLLPLAQSAFNESRLPIKFADYLAAGLPVFCSDVGECGHLARELSGVTLLPADRAAWAAGVAQRVRAALDGQSLPLPDRSRLFDRLHWDRLGDQLSAAYRRAGAGGPGPSV